MSERTEWSPEECSKIVRRDALLEEHIVEQHIDSITAKGPTFSLYYFVKDQTYENPKKPTVLFAAGGPGQMVLASSGDNFLDMLGYRVVYFHLRGTGFSQLPADTSFDKYLRTDYVVEDIEAIRRDFLSDSKWAAVIGHSYGAVVAQCYAHKFPNSVEKVVLSAPVAPVTALNREAVSSDTPIEPKPLENLRRIYERDEFAFLDDILMASNIRLKEYVVNLGEDIIKKVERLHWNIPFVSEEYARLERELKKHGLDLGAPFFRAVRKLRLCGWLPLNVPLARVGDEVDTAQLESGLIIADAVLKKLNPSKNLEENLRKLIADASGQKKEDLKSILGVLQFCNQQFSDQRFPIKNSQNTARGYYVISLFDGLNEKFQTELAKHSDVKKALQSIGGQNGPNRSLEKAAIALSKPPKPWDPATRPQRRPTLILKGGADPLTELGEAEYYFNHGLKGKKALVEFPGVGHSMALPNLLNRGAGIDQISYRENGETKLDSLGPREALIHAFLTKPHAEFKIAEVLTQIELAFGDALNGFEKSRPWSKKAGRSSKVDLEPLPTKFSP